MSASREGKKIDRPRLGLFLNAAALRGEKLKACSVANEKNLATLVESFKTSYESKLIELSGDPDKTITQISEMQKLVSNFDQQTISAQKTLKFSQEKLARAEVKLKSMSEMQRKNEPELKNQIDQSVQSLRDKFGLLRSLVEWESRCLAMISAHDYTKAQDLLNSIKDASSILFELVKGFRVFRSADAWEILPWLFGVRNELKTATKMIDEIKETGSPIVAAVVWKGKNNDSILPIFISQGVNINAQTSDTQSTALHFAVQLKSFTDVMMLCSHYADPSIKNKDNKTALELIMVESKNSDEQSMVSFLKKYEVCYQLKDVLKRKKEIDKLVSKYSNSDQKKCVIC